MAVTHSSPSANALKPTTPALSRRPAIPPISHVLFTLRTTKDVDNFAAARKLCLEWLAYRAGRPIPVPAWSGASFELEDVGAQRVGAVSIEAPKYWSARLDDAD